MKFIKLHLDGFGKLVDRTFAFAPGLNLIFGPNEAGKSTLQQALLTLLYGFYDEGSVTKAKRETVKAFTPWMPGADFAGSLIYQLGDGRTFRVVRSFSGQPTIRLDSFPDGQDASFEYRSASHGRLFFADVQLGMSKGVFENTCVVRQAELVALEESAMAITDTLMRLSASASQDTTTADALALLDKTLRDEIGTDRAWTKPLAQTRKRLDELQAAQQKAMKTRREVFALIAELNQERAQLEALDEEIERLQYLAALAEQQTIQAQIDASVQADAEAERLAVEVERWKTRADFPAHLRDQVVRLDGECTRLTGELEEHASRVAEVRQQRAALANRLNAAEAKVAALTDVKDVPADRLSQIQRLTAQWESARTAEQTAQTRLKVAEERLAQLEQSLAAERAVLGNVVDLGPVGMAQLRQRWIAARQRIEQTQAALQQTWAEWNRVGLSDEQFQAMAEMARQVQAGTYVEERPRNGCRFWSRLKAPPGPPPEIAIYTQVKPIRDKLDEARAEDRTAKDGFATVGMEARQHLGLEPEQELDQAQFEAANQRLAGCTRLASEVDVQRQAVTVARTEAEDTRRQAETARNALVHAIDAVGYTAADLQTAVHAFEKACERKEQYDRAAAELQQLRAEDRLLAQEEQAQARRQEALHTACQSLQTTLTQAGIAVVGDALSDAVADFEKRHRNHQRWRRAQDNYQAALVRPASGLTQHERDAARRRLAGLKRQLKAWQADHPDWGKLEADHDAHEYRARSRKLEASRQAKQERCTQLRESKQRITRDLPHPAELAEEITAAQARVRRLEHLRDVLTLARDELEAATQEFQRIFAPRLEQLVADGLTRVTQGRYSQVTIDPATLAITLAAPEQSAPVEAALLSTGTRDLIYLLLRIGIGQMMSRTGEMLPLLLDDPLVQFDRDRQEHALRLLADLAEETQIILFTKDGDILRWFQEELAGNKRHHLQMLGDYIA